ncbi:MAG: hypothetical protein R3C05_01800 [Pirellulaceae bacterium]
MVQPEAVLIVRGVVDRRGGGDDVNLIVNELVPLDQLDSKYTRGILIDLEEAMDESMLPKVARSFVAILVIKN